MERHTAKPPPAGASPRVESQPEDLPPPQAVKEAFARFAELREFVAYYVSTRIDLVKLTIRRAGILAVLGIIALLAASTVVVTATVLVCIGLADMIGAALGRHAWAANLITGAAILAVIGVGGWIGVRWLMSSVRKQMVRKYELRRQKQRRDFGHDVKDRADESR